MVATVTSKTGHKVRPPSLRLASFDDYEDIAAVEAANGLSFKAREEWLHLWQNNPAYRQLSGWPIGWVLEDEDGRIVGALENIPCLYRLDGRTYVAAFGRGWAVDIRYRVYSILLLVRQRKQPHVDLLATSTASARTSTVLSGLGWSRVPVGEWDRSAYWITNYAETARRYLEAKFPKPVSALAGPLVCSPLALKDAMARRSRVSPKGFTLDWCAAFDERFDQFWTEFESQNPNLLLSVRDRQTLTWHFKYALARNRIWILTASDGPRLLAYAVFERRPTQELDLERLLLVDYQALSKDSQLGEAMISVALERCRSEGVHVLENPGCWLESMQRLVNRAPYRRRLKTWCYLYQAVNRDLGGVIQHAAPWRPTLYDTDASL